jgi:hypothetical protein
MYVQLSLNGLLLTAFQTGNIVYLSKRVHPENLLADQSNGSEGS